MRTLTELMDAVNERFDALIAGQDRIANDLAPLKTAVAYDEAFRTVARIARIANCRQYRVMGLGEILDLVERSDTAGIVQNDLDDFENADIIIEATQRDNGAVHYIVVEASYTAGRKAARRAIRNAEFVTRFTGRPAHAVVAAQRVYPSLDPLLESGALHWVRILQKELEMD